MELKMSTRDRVALVLSSLLIAPLMELKKRLLCDRLLHLRF